MAGVDRLFRSTAARVVWMSFCLVSLIMATSYSGNLVAALATQNVRLPFRTLDELTEDNLYTLKIRIGGVHQSLLQVGTDQLREKKTLKFEYKVRFL